MHGGLALGEALETSRTYPAPAVSGTHSLGSSSALGIAARKTHLGPFRRAQALCALALEGCESPFPLSVPQSAHRTGSAGSTRTARWCRRNGSAAGPYRR